MPYKNIQKRKEFDKEYHKKYRKKYPERVKKVEKKRFNKRNFGGMRDFILQRDNWQCVKCGMNQEQHILLFGKSLTIDHIKGNGKYDKNSENPNNSLGNLQTLCLRCHGKKDCIKRIWRKVKII